MNRSITLPELSSNFLEALRTYGYSEDSLKRFSRVLKELCEYANGESYSQRLGAEFLSQAIRGLKGFVTSGEHSKTEMYYLRVIRSLNKYWYFGTLFRNETCLGPIVWPKKFADAVYGFLEEKAAYRCSESIIRQYEKVIQDFLLFLDANNAHGLSEITPMLISRYIASLTGYIAKAVAGRISRLRGWFQYLFLREHTQKDLTTVLPKARGSFRQKLPTV